MARNIEIKAKVEDLESVRGRAVDLNPHHQETIFQTDTFFNVEQGRLKLREFQDGSAELIFYNRDNQSGPKLSQYWRSPCPDPESMLKILSESNGIRGVVKKQRDLMLVGQTRIHLDQVDQLGSFLELEVVLNDDQDQDAGFSVARDIMEKLKIDHDNLQPLAYIDLIELSKV